MTAQGQTAVALHYSEDLPAPMVVASGRGALAEVIQRIARENGVPLVSDPDLAETLVELDVNSLIPESLYEVIASIFVFLRGIGAGGAAAG